MRVSCPICENQIFDTIQDLRLHLSSDLHSFTDIDLHSHTLQSLTPPLLICQHCKNKQGIFIGEQGLKLHFRKKHQGQQPKQLSNLLLIEELFPDKDGLKKWKETLEKLENYQPQPPSFRRSLFHQIGKDDKAVFLNWQVQILSLIEKADFKTRTESVENSSYALLLLFHLMEMALLAPPTESEPHNHQELMKERFHRFTIGEFFLLLEETQLPRAKRQHSNPPSLSRKRQKGRKRKMKQTQRQQEINDRKQKEQLNQRIEESIQAGNYNKAVQALKEEPRANLEDKEIWNKLKEMHVTPVQPIEDHQSPPFPSVDLYHLNRFDETLRSSTKYKAPGLWADSPDVLILLADRQVPGTNLSGGDLLKNLAALYLKDQVPNRIWDLHRKNVMAAFHKDPERPLKLRPIGIGTAWRRMLTRHLVQVSTEELTAFFLPHQYAIGAKGGLDFLTTIVTDTIDRLITQEEAPDQPYALLKLDFENMFNSVSRTEVREQTDKHFPHFTFLFDKLYPAGGNEVWARRGLVWDFFIQNEGFAQGCPLSPFFACLVLQELMVKLSSNLEQRAQIRERLTSFLVAYMDDQAAIANIEDIKYIFQFFQTEGPGKGLHLSKEKCEILLSTKGTSPMNRFSKKTQADLYWAASTFCQKTENLFQLKGTNFLGTPLGQPTFVENALNENNIKFRKTVSDITEKVFHPASRLRLFYFCIQQQVGFKQFADSCLPSTKLHLTGSETVFTKQLTKVIKDFFGTLTETATISETSWGILTTSLADGGLGILDPAITETFEFVRRFIRTIHYCSQGYPVKGTNTRLQLPAYLTKPFLTTTKANWQSKFFSLLPDLMDEVSLTTTTESFLHSRTFDPVKKLQSIKRGILMNNTRKYFDKTESDLPLNHLNSLTSYPFVNTPLDCADYRMSGSCFILALKRKLRIPLFEVDTICACGRTVDKFGDHLFHCTNLPKTSLHNRLRDNIYHILTFLAPLSDLVDSDRVIRIEESGLLPAYPKLRPADVVLKINQTSIPAYSHLLMDIKTVQCTPKESFVTEKLTRQSIHWNGEHLKFSAWKKNSPNYIREINDHHYLLFPVTIDPEGFTGSLFSSFLWGSHPPLNFPEQKECKIDRNKPSSIAERNARAAIKDFSLFAKADKRYKEQHGSKWFAPHYATTKPSHWAKQILGFNIIHAHAKHAQKSILSLPEKEKQQNLKIKGIQPSVSSDHYPSGKRTKLSDINI